MGLRQEIITRNIFTFFVVMFRHNGKCRKRFEENIGRTVKFSENRSGLGRL